MPRYHCLDTKVRLSVANLAATVTANPKQKKSATATSYVENTENILKNGTSLSEEHVPFTNEDGDEGEGYLHFLGRHKNMPFMMVHAGADLFKPVRAHDNSSPRISGRKSLSRVSLGSSTSTLTSLATSPRNTEADEIEERIRDSQQKEHRASGPSTRNNPHPSRPSVAPSEHSARHSPPPHLPLSTENLHRALKDSEADMVPHALALQVFLSPKTFICDFSESPKAQDVKIDVFFNGLLSSSYYVSSRDHNNLQSKFHHQIFAGSRLHYLQERPWVILPPGQEADGSLRGLKRSKTASMGPQERWEQIGAALLAEADKRGFNKYGDRPPTGEYLESLAHLKMPKAVQGMQRPGGPKFGVIDVVISVGEGKKYIGSANYLKQPTGLEDSRYKPLSEEERRKRYESVQEATEQGISDATMMRLRGSAQGMQKSVPAPSLEASRTVSTSESNLPPSSPRKSSSHDFFSSREMPPPQTPVSSFSTIQAKRRHNSSISVHGETTVKRQRTSERISGVSMAKPQSVRNVTPASRYGISRRGVFTYARSPWNISPSSPVSNRSSAGESASRIQIEGNPFEPRVELPLISSMIGASITTTAMLSGATTASNAAKLTSARSSIIIKRIVITANGKTVRDATLSIPQHLAIKPPFRRSSRVSRSETPGLVSSGESASASARRKNKYGARDPATLPPSSPRTTTAGQNNGLTSALGFSGPEAVTAKSTSRLRSSSSTRASTKPLSYWQISTTASNSQDPFNPFHATNTVGDPAAPTTPDPKPPPKRKRRATEAAPLPALPTSPSPPKPKPKPKPRRKTAAAPPLSSLHASRAAATKPRTEYPPFVTPPLSQDCIITYARAGQWSMVPVGKTGVGAEEVVRQVRCERPGMFREADVVFGVRFLIG